MKYDIFISYRRADRELAASIVRRLDERGVGVWYDADIEGGADWREVILEALTRSTMLAMFFSEDCNNSRQLKKELAIADHLGKPVVPILIENTQPRGAYLYELADRNWIQIYPEPIENIEELVEHLATLAGKSDGGLARAGPGGVKAKTVRMEAAPASEALARGAQAASAPTATAAMAQEQPLDAAVGEFIADAEQPTRASPKIAKAYVGRVSNSGIPIRRTNEILPFKWVDLVVLILLLAQAIYLNAIIATWPPDAKEAGATALWAITGVAAYGALVFPIRDYLRGRPPAQALNRYLLSSAILYAMFLASYLSLRYGANLFAGETPFQIVGAGVWIGFTLLAFLVYGVLAGQRAIRSFRSNIRKI